MYAPYLNNAVACRVPFPPHIVHLFYKTKPPTKPKAPTPTPSQAPYSFCDPPVEPSDAVSAEFGSAPPPTPPPAAVVPDVPPLSVPLLSPPSLVALSLSPSPLSPVDEVAAPLEVLLMVRLLAEVGDAISLESIVEAPDIMLDPEVMAGLAMEEADIVAELSVATPVATEGAPEVTRLATPSPAPPTPPCRR
ncbi:MAG: hypothetical protein LQ346_004209 [Caloplaca aetnensis]|nr:MAG: hypothetical protein LQ346_004209 [Caloplaca aetnensis]